MSFLRTAANEKKIDRVNGENELSQGIKVQESDELSETFAREICISPGVSYSHVLNASCSFSKEERHRIVVLSHFPVPDLKIYLAETLKDQFSECLDAMRHEIFLWDEGVVVPSRIEIDTMDQVIPRAHQMMSLERAERLAVYILFFRITEGPNWIGSLSSQGRASSLVCSKLKDCYFSADFQAIRNAHNFDDNPDLLQTVQHLQPQIQGGQHQVINGNLYLETHQSKPFRCCDQTQSNQVQQDA
jgi:hypothetical protein